MSSKVMKFGDNQEEEEEEEEIYLAQTKIQVVDNIIQYNWVRLPENHTGQQSWPSKHIQFLF